MSYIMTKTQMHVELLGGFVLQNRSIVSVHAHYLLSIHTYEQY